MFPILETERLLLRQITYNDAPAIMSIRSNAETMRYIPRPLTTTLEEAKQLIDVYQLSFEKNEGIINWAITPKIEPKLVGMISFPRTSPENNRAELGYVLHPDYTEKGYMSEAVAEVIKFGFEKMGFHKIEAIIDPRNISSQKVLEKANFIKEGHLKDNVFWNNAFSDSVYYGYLKSDYNKLITKVLR